MFSLGDLAGVFAFGVLLGVLAFAGNTRGLPKATDDVDTLGVFLGVPFGVPLRVPPFVELLLVLALAAWKE